MTPKFNPKNVWWWVNFQFQYSCSGYRKWVICSWREDFGYETCTKVLLSLPQRFSMKFTAIEEASDVTIMKLDQLFGSLLRTFEFNLGEGDSKWKSRVYF